MSAKHTSLESLSAKDYLREIGRKGGKSRSKRKRETARQNMKKAHRVMKQLNKGRAT